MSLVTIIIPSYNHSKFLKKRLDTIQEQTFKDWELIIIDDFSKDNSVTILEEFANKNKEKVKHFIKNKINSGSGYNSWKKGIELSNSKYIWIAETDDYSDSTFLENQIEVLEKTNAVLSFCASKYVDFKGEYMYNSSYRTRDLKILQGEYNIFDSNVFVDKMPFNTLITNGSSVVFSRPENKIPEKIFKFKQSSDIFLWTYLIKNNNFIFLNKELNFFRRHEDSTTSKTSKYKKEFIYSEAANYLNMFNLEFKYIEFIKHYIKYYINSNRKEIFNTKSIKIINKTRYKIFVYYFQVLLFFGNKLIKKIIK